MGIKNKEVFNGKELVNEINYSTSPYHCVSNIEIQLKNNNYIKLYENKPFNLEPGKKYYVTRNDSSIIAFTIPKNIKSIESVNLVASHTDSPTFRIKNNPIIKENGYTKLNVMIYGGMIQSTWFDRPLSIAGRVIAKRDGKIKPILFDIYESLLIIPSQAIHINRENNTINPQVDLLPIVSKNIDSIEELIKSSDIIDSNDKILDYDLYLYNTDKSTVMNDLVVGPRLDDQACVFSSLKSFYQSNNSNTINVYCAFNNEEIGSNTNQGADSTFLSDVLARVGKELNIDISTLLRNGIAISADNAHAVHPNASSKADPTNKVYLNKGIAIKHHTNYTTDGLTSAVMKEICDNANVPYQDYEHRSDMRCGATLGCINQSHVPVDTVDIGIPQLAMHSTVETCGTEDVYNMYKALLEYYNSTIIREDNNIIIKK